MGGKAGYSFTDSRIGAKEEPHTDRTKMLKLLDTNDSRRPSVLHAKGDAGWMPMIWSWGSGGGGQRAEGRKGRGRQ